MNPALRLVAHADREVLHELRQQHALGVAEAAERLEHREGDGERRHQAEHGDVGERAGSHRELVAAEAALHHRCQAQHGEEHTFQRRRGVEVALPDVADEEGDGAAAEGASGRGGAASKIPHGSQC